MRPRLRRMSARRCLRELYEAEATVYSARVAPSRRMERTKHRREAAAIPLGDNGGARPRPRGRPPPPRALRGRGVRARVPYFRGRQGRRRWLEAAASPAAEKAAAAEE
jgi:hypothetical protein